MRIQICFWGVVVVGIRAGNRGDAFDKGRDNVKRLVLEVELGR